jgi:DNA segregation ATPase FtsK/SpoIIIE-like protein
MGIKARHGDQTLLPEKKGGAWFLPAGLSPADIERSLPALSYQLNAEVEMEVRGKAVFLCLFPPLPPNVPYELINLKSYNLGLVLGKSNRSDALVHDLNDSSPYIIIAGGVGMGKSNSLNVMLSQIEANYCREQVEWHLVDLKLGVEFGPWADSPLCASTCFEAKRLPDMLSDLSREVRRRMKLFKRLGVYKIDDYNKLDVAQLPYLLLVVDEYAEISREKEVEGQMQSLLQIGRAGGLRVIISTQRPTGDNISTSIKGLIPARLCFSVADQVNSRVVLDAGGAEQLGGHPGRGILLSGARYTKVQVQKFAGRAGNPSGLLRRPSGS